MGQGRTVALILITVGLTIALAASVFLFAGWAEGRLRMSGFLLGLVIVGMLCLPLFGGGVFLLVRSRGEAREFAEAAKEKMILNIVRTQGKVDVAGLAIEMGLTRSQVKEYLYDLVGKELFTGYINWEEGILYARDAGEMQTTKCPNCGGIREVVGKGVVKCPYCGSDLFL
jgi:hypothetical protein